MTESSIGFVGGDGWLFLKARGRGRLSVGFAEFLACRCGAGCADSGMGSMIGAVLLKARVAIADHGFDRSPGEGARSSNTERRSALLIVTSWLAPGTRCGRVRATGRGRGLKVVARPRSPKLKSYRLGVLVVRGCSAGLA